MRINFQREGESLRFIKISSAPEFNNAYPIVNINGAQNRKNLFLD
jgi:hypothetical protein